LAGGHLFLKLFQLASQKWLPKSQIGWEHVPTVPIFLEPWSELEKMHCTKIVKGVFFKPLSEDPGKAGGCSTNTYVIH
jgi:hypothetical protein